ncbi:UDP-glucose 4-epimerase GalE [Pectobacterium punjabense]|uniref:UDP-glucose 4-epimerase GalE n=1 Tax=Pectobacterium punjabense TaxID=2108399 RepID=UPI0032F08E40
MSILVTGGAGYIGSHTVLALLQKGEDVVVIDNFVNSSPVALERVAQIADKSPVVYDCDIRDNERVNDIFSRHSFSHVIHFAGLKSVSESIKRPLDYYAVNVMGTMNVIQAMYKFEVRNFIFSSSATVYGLPEKIPLTEECKVGGTTNPYGTSKLVIEKMLKDINCSDPDFNVTILRYFNPVGAHCSGLIGEDPNGVPGNLVPFIAQVAIGKLKSLFVFGNDYHTNDGTGVRDYIHVVDLANGHLSALNKQGIGQSYNVYNLGTGKGYSVLEMIHTFNDVNGTHVSYEFMPRRPGDVAECWSDPSLAMNELGWSAKLGIEDMLRDAWNWQVKNPNGYLSI